jgi:hypothetical protein
MKKSASQRRLVEQQGMPIAAARVLAWLQTAVAGPFLDFVRRYRWHACCCLR